MVPDRSLQHSIEIDRSDTISGHSKLKVNGRFDKIDCTDFETHSREPICAINCTEYCRRISPRFSAANPRSSGLKSSPAALREILSNSISEATKRAYGADIRHFEAYGGDIPATSEQIAEYLAAISSTHTAATITRRIAALSKAHRAVGVDDPCRAELVKATLRGIKRRIGTAQREAKPLLREDLFVVLERMGERPKDVRDKALLLLGFAGAFRRSELVALEVADIEHVRQGIVITICRSKTDQVGAGRKVGVPFGRTRWCPVRHLGDWLSIANVENGPLFRGIDRHGHVSGQRLSGEAVSIIIKQRVAAAGFDPDVYSGHSLRSGLATSAVIAGVNTLSIRRTTGHASDAMLARYVRIGDIFNDNAAAAVL